MFLKRNESTSNILLLSIMVRDLLLASVLEVLWGIEQFSVMFRTETTNEKLYDAPQDKRKVVKPAANRLFMAKEPNPVRRPGFLKGY